MVRAVPLVLLALVALAAALKDPNFPVWPSSYSTTITSESTSGSTITDVYVDAVNRRNRYDVPSADGAVTELVFQPANPSVRTYPIATGHFCWFVCLADHSQKED